MNDIAKCHNSTCPMASCCKRFVQQQNRSSNSYQCHGKFSFKVGKNGLECDGYIQKTPQLIHYSSMSIDQIQKTQFAD